MRQLRKMGKMKATATDFKDIECFVLDMDGTINLGNNLIDGAMDLINYFFENNIKFYFFTNNSSKSPKAYVKKLEQLGFSGITLEHIMTSGDVMIHYIKTHNPNSTVYLCGTDELKEQFERAGINLMPRKTEKANFAVLGFDTTLDYEKIDDLCRVIDNGGEFLATNIDVVCPLENNRHCPDCGAMAKMITHATGVEPKFVGKPFKETVDFILAKTCTDKKKTAIVGDRLYTDIKTAQNGGIIGIAVLSGEVTYDEIIKSDVETDYIVESVKDIYNELSLYKKVEGEQL